MSPEPITLRGAHDLAASKHVEPDKSAWITWSMCEPSQTG